MCAKHCASNNRNKKVVFAYISWGSIADNRKAISAICVPKEDLDNKKQTAQDFLRVGEERSNTVERRYDLALRMCNDGCRSKIGNSDTEIRQKLEILHLRYEQIQRSVEQLQLVLDNAGQRTKTYGLNMTNLVDGSTQYLAELVAALEKLKEVKK